MSDTNPIRKKVSFGTVSLQQLRRVALPALLTENMKISEGDELPSGLILTAWRPFS